VTKAAGTDQPVRDGMTANIGFGRASTTTTPGDAYPRYYDFTTSGSARNRQVLGRISGLSGYSPSWATPFDLSAARASPEAELLL